MHNLVDNLLAVAIFPLRSGLPPFVRLDFASQFGVRLTVCQRERLAASRGRTFKGATFAFEHLLDGLTREGVFAHGSSNKIERAFKVGNQQNYDV